MKSIKEILEPFILEKDGAKINHLYSHNAEYLIKQLEENQREFGKGLLELAADKAEMISINDYNKVEAKFVECKELTFVVNKENILNTLDDYLLNNKI